VDRIQAAGTVRDSVRVSTLPLDFPHCTRTVLEYPLFSILTVLPPLRGEGLPTLLPEEWFASDETGVGGKESRFSLSNPTVGKP